MQNPSSASRILDNSLYQALGASGRPYTGFMKTFESLLRLPHEHIGLAIQRSPRKKGIGDIPDKPIFRPTITRDEMKKYHRRNSLSMVGRLSTWTCPDLLSGHRCPWRHSLALAFTGKSLSKGSFRPAFLFLNTYRLGKTPSGRSASTLLSSNDNTSQLL